VVGGCRYYFRRRWARERRWTEGEIAREAREWRADGRVGASLMVQMDVSGR
jgi:hypothetical protein